MSGTLDLERFVRAQNPVLAQVIQELTAGQKRTHWMWFVFPQLRGLGYSAMAQKYAIASLAEAQAYLAHPLLGTRLATCTDLVNKVVGRSAHDIFASPDDRKFHSSMTLFTVAEPGASPFRTALDIYFAGCLDDKTTSLLNTEKKGVLF